MGIRAQAALAGELQDEGGQGEGEGNKEAGTEQTR